MKHIAHYMPATAKNAVKCTENANPQKTKYASKPFILPDFMTPLNILARVSFKWLSLITSSVDLRNYAMTQNTQILKLSPLNIDT